MIIIRPSYMFESYGVLYGCNSGGSALLDKFKYSLQRISYEYPITDEWYHCYCYWRLYKIDTTPFLYALHDNLKSYIIDPLDKYDDNTICFIVRKLQTLLVNEK